MKTNNTSSFSSGLPFYEKRKLPLSPALASHRHSNIHYILLHVIPAVKLCVMALRPRRVLYRKRQETWPKVPHSCRCFAIQSTPTASYPSTHRTLFYCMAKYAFNYTMFAETFRRKEGRRGRENIANESNRDRYMSSVCVPMPGRWQIRDAGYLLFMAQIFLVNCEA